MTTPRVLLIVGPGGSGKTTLAQGIAERLGWTCIGEDDHWVANGWGHGLRTPEQEGVVQAQVLDDLLAAVRSGRHVVLELILYRPPPSPLTAYREVLVAHGIAHDTVALRPSVAAIVGRLRGRGRPTDLADLGRRRIDAVLQLGCVQPEHVDPAWIVDPTDLTADALLDLCTTTLHLEPVAPAFDEAWAEWTIEQLLAVGVDIDPGLAEADLVAADAAFGAPVPPELRLLLAAGIPVSPRWARWAEGPEVVAADGRAHLEHIFRFDVVRNGYWHPLLGDRPADDAAAVDAALAVVLAAPPLIPVYGHRMLTTMPVGPRPVLSVHAPSDTISYGGDLAHHLTRDHGIPAPPWPEPSVTSVPVWDELFEDVR